MQVTLVMRGGYCGIAPAIRFHRALRPTAMKMKDAITNAEYPIPYHRSKVRVIPHRGARNRAPSTSAGPSTYKGGMAAVGTIPCFRQSSALRHNADMTDVVHLLWFAKEMPQGEDDIELLIGVYSSNDDARAAIERIKDKPGFADFPQGFEVCPYSLDHDHWADGFVLDGKRAWPRWQA